MKDQSVKLLAKFLTWSMVISSVATAMFFISLGLSALFNELLESTFLGYLIVAGIYLLIGLITYLSRKMIERSLMVQVKDSDLLEVTIDEDE